MFYDALTEPSPTSQTFYDIVRMNGAYTRRARWQGRGAQSAKLGIGKKQERRQRADDVTERNRAAAAAEEKTVVEDCTSEDDFPQQVGPLLERLDGYPYDFIGEEPGDDGVNDTVAADVQEVTMVVEPGDEVVNDALAADVEEVTTVVEDFTSGDMISLSIL